jgi:hypothetical protein
MKRPHDELNVGVAADRAQAVRQCVSLNETSLFKAIELDGDGQIITDSEKLKNIQLLLQRLDENALVTGLVESCGAEEMRASLRASKLDVANITAIFNQHKDGFVHSDYVFQHESYPSKIDGAFGGNVLLQSNKAVLKRCKDSPSALTVLFNPPDTNHTSARIEFTFDEYDYSSVCVQLHTQQLFTLPLQSSFLELSVASKWELHTVLKSFLCPKDRSCVHSLLNYLSSAAPKHSILPPSVQCLPEDCGVSSGYGALSDIRFVDPSNPRPTTSWVIAAAMSRFACYLKIPVVMDAARLAEMSIMIRPEKFIQWKVAAVDKCTFEHTHTDQTSRGIVRHMKLVATFHPLFTRCICGLYHNANDANVSKSIVSKDTHVCKLVISACGANIMNGDVQCCRKKSRHSCVAGRKRTCFEAVSVKLQCFHSADSSDRSYTDHHILLSDAEYAYAQLLLKKASYLNERCKEVYSSEDEFNELDEIHSQVDRDLRAAENKIDRSLFDACTPEMDLDVSVAMANHSAVHTNCLLKGCAKNTHNASADARVSYSRLQWTKGTAQPCNVAMTINKKPSMLQMAYVYGRIVPAKHRK